MVSEGQVLEQFIDALRCDAAAPTPMGLDPELAEFVRHLVRLQPTAHLDPLTMRRIWQRALGGASCVETLAPGDNNRHPFRMSEDAIEEESSMTTSVRPFPQVGRVQGRAWALLAAALACVIFFGGLLPYLLNNVSPSGPQSVWISTANENQELFERYINEAWNAGDTAVLDDLLTADHACYEPGVSGQAVGVAHMTQMIGNFRTAFPDWQFAIEDLAATDTGVTARLVGTGTQSGPFTYAEGVTVEPSGHPVTLEVMLNAQFADGKIAGQWFQYDTMALLEQLGAAKGPEESLTEQRNVEIARGWLDAAFHADRLDLLDEYCAPTIAWHRGGRGGGTMGASDQKAWHEAFLANLKNVTVGVEKVYADHDLVTLQYWMSGILVSDSYLSPVLNRSVEPVVPGQTYVQAAYNLIFRINDDGKIVEAWLFEDLPFAY